MAIRFKKKKKINFRIMRVSDICFGKLKEFEGLRTEAYYDPAGVLTIGYGHTGHDVRPGDVISKYWAEHLLKADLYDTEKAVESLGVARTQGQFDALVSFAFNLGFYKLKTAGRSSRGWKGVASGRPDGSSTTMSWRP